MAPKRNLFDGILSVAADAQRLNPSQLSLCSTLCVRVSLGLILDCNFPLDKAGSSLRWPRFVSSPQVHYIDLWPRNGRIGWPFRRQPEDPHILATYAESGDKLEYGGAATCLVEGKPPQLPFAAIGRAFVEETCDGGIVTSAFGQNEQLRLVDANRPLHLWTEHFWPADEDTQSEHWRMRLLDGVGRNALDVSEEAGNDAQDRPPASTDVVCGQLASYKCNACHL